MANARRFSGQFIGGFAVDARPPNLLVVGLAIDVAAGGKSGALATGFIKAIFFSYSLLY